MRAMSSFKIGDRVFIRGHDHPHSGKTGTIAAPFSSRNAPDLTWRVSLDDWSEAAVADADIRKAD
jgi:hypothetical protein